MFAGTRRALPWFFAYLMLMILSGILDFRFSGMAEPLAPSVMVIFFVMNVVGVSTIAYLLIRYFVRERERALDALGKAHEEVSQDRERISKIKSVLAHFVPSTAKDMIEKDPDWALRDKYIQDATVLFLDVEGFTTLVQKYTHEEINRAIETYFSMFFDIIQQCGGDVNETAGDGMMVIFLDPDPSIHSQKAVQAALDIQRKCDEHPHTVDSALPSIRVSIGISSGEVYLGSTKMRGTEGDRWTFTASGPVTILAARLSEYGSGGQTLIGEETARRIREVYSLNPMGRVTLKNLEDSGEIYEVKGPLNAREALR
jgi:class 3 adenylate cyclase